MFKKANLHKEKSKAYFDQLAARYETSGNGRHASTIYPYLFERLSHLFYRSILDVGCGTGEVLSKIVGQKDLFLAGIDLSPNMISIAQEKLKGYADIRVGEAEELPWPDNSFDVILCLDSFHHYPDPLKVLAEIRRVAKPDGQLFLADFWAPAPFRQIMNLSLHYGWGDGTVEFYSKRTICRFLKSAGFTGIQWGRISYNAYFATAAKPI